MKLVLLYRLWFGVLLLLGAGGTLASCAKLTPAQEAVVARDQIELGLCATEAHLDKSEDGGSNAKAWTTFDDCMCRKGFYEGGACHAH